MRARPLTQLTLPKDKTLVFTDVDSVAMQCRKMEDIIHHQVSSHPTDFAEALQLYYNGKTKAQEVESALGFTFTPRAFNFIASRSYYCLSPILVSLCNHHNNADLALQLYNFYVCAAREKLAGNISFIALDNQRQVLEAYDDSVSSLSFTRITDVIKDFHDRYSTHNSSIAPAHLIISEDLTEWCITFTDGSLTRRVSNSDYYHYLPSITVSNCYEGPYDKPLKFFSSYLHKSALLLEAYLPRGHEDVNNHIQPLLFPECIPAQENKVSQLKILKNIFSESLKDTLPAESDSEKIIEDILKLHHRCNPKEPIFVADIVAGISRLYVQTSMGPLFKQFEELLLKSHSSLNNIFNKE